MSPSPPSGSESQQLTPLLALTRRLGSQDLIWLTMRAGSYSPQPSLNGTQVMIDGWLRCCSTSALSWFSNGIFTVSGGVCEENVDGMSCHTRRPSRSAQQYQRSGSTLT